MFTWICPRCGREVPPSAKDCPECAGRDQAGTAPQPAPPAAPPPPDPIELLRKPSPAPAPKPSKVPSWLLTLVFAVVFLSLGAISFLAYRYFSQKSQSPSAQSGDPARTSPSVPAAPVSPTVNLLNKYLEVTGIRLLEENPKNLQVAFVVVNHSEAPLTDIAGTVSIRPVNSPPTGEAVGNFAFRLPELRPNEAKDMKAPLQTKLRVYELPDWQFIRADVTITSPPPNP